VSIGPDKSVSLKLAPAGEKQLLFFCHQLFQEWVFQCCCRIRSFVGIGNHHVLCHLVGQGFVQEGRCFRLGDVLSAGLLEAFPGDAATVFQEHFHQSTNGVNIKGVHRGVHGRGVFLGFGWKKMLGCAVVMDRYVVGFVPKRGVPVKEMDLLAVPIVIIAVQIAVHNVAGMDELHRFQHRFHQSPHLVQILRFALALQEVHGDHTDSSLCNETLSAPGRDTQVISQIRRIARKKRIGHGTNRIIQFGNVGNAGWLLELAEEINFQIGIVQIAVGCNLGNHRLVLIPGLEGIADVASPNLLDELEIVVEGKGVRAGRCVGILILAVSVYFNLGFCSVGIFETIAAWSVQAFNCFCSVGIVETIAAWCVQAYNFVFFTPDVLKGCEGLEAIYIASDTNIKGGKQECIKHADEVCASVHGCLLGCLFRSNATTNATMTNRKKESEGWLIVVSAFVTGSLIVSLLRCYVVTLLRYVVTVTAPRTTVINLSLSFSHPYCVRKKLSIVPYAVPGSSLFDF